MIVHNVISDFGAAISGIQSLACSSWMPPPGNGSSENVGQESRFLSGDTASADQGLQTREILNHLIRTGNLRSDNFANSSGQEKGEASPFSSKGIILKLSPEAEHILSQTRQRAGEPSASSSFALKALNVSITKVEAESENDSISSYDRQRANRAYSSFILPALRSQFDLVI